MSKQKLFLVVTLVSPIAFVLFVILHNFFYAFGVMTQHFPSIHFVMEALHVVFFLISTLLCPLAFVVGVVGSIVLLVKKILAKSSQTKQ